MKILLVYFVTDGNGPLPLSEVEIAGVKKWNRRDQKSYGICISLYEQHPVSGKMSGLFESHIHNTNKVPPINRKVLELGSFLEKYLI